MTGALSDAQTAIPDSGISSFIHRLASVKSIDWPVMHNMQSFWILPRVFPE